MADAKYRALYGHLKDSLSDFTAESTTVQDLLETCVDVLERMQTLASASNYGSLEAAVPGVRSRLVARQLESVDALVRALQEALTGMAAATEIADRLAVDGAHLAAAAAPTPASAARCAGAGPCPASAADTLADAARGMRNSTATARVAAETVECSPDVGGLKALLCTLKDSPSFDALSVVESIEAVMASAEPEGVC